ncbi:MAG: transposase [Planctomycetaceae bacterium]
MAVEQTRRALINALLMFQDLNIFPVNPAALANYRKAFAHGGGKNDPADAQLLCQYLSPYRDQLRPLKRDEPLTRELASLGEDRRKLVDQRVAFANELRAILKLYYPVILALGAAQMYADFQLSPLAGHRTLHSAPIGATTNQPGASPQEHQARSPKS